jgi:CheY-like chemotaxis protein
VDDDPSIRRLLVTYLSQRGFRLLEASNGREALAQMRGADLVIMDLMMPEVSGMDVLRVRAADPALLRIPVIVVTANIQQNAAADVLDASVWAVIGKPFDLDALLKSVTTCLAQRPHIPAPAAARPPIVATLRAPRVRVARSAG